MSELAPASPSSLDRVLGHALAKNADERYRSAVELIEDLRAVRAGASPKHAAAHDQHNAQKTLVSRALTSESADVEATLASAPRAPLWLAHSKRLAIGLGLFLVLAFWFRTELGREMQLWRADRTASAGELVESEALLETLLEEHPEFDWPPKSRAEHACDAAVTGLTLVGRSDYLGRVHFADPDDLMVTSDLL